jgi:aminopeptidase-like protein
MTSIDQLLEMTAPGSPATIADKQTLKTLLSHFNRDREGLAAYAIIEALYPICRSITGDGVRQSLRLLQRTIPLNVHEVPSGKQVFDWAIPNEWNIRDAYIKNSAGERVVDFRKNNLHLLNYSVPVHRTMSLDELRPYLFTLPEMPDWIPYRTSYFKETWGFCLSQRQLDEMKDGQYEVFIGSTLKPGHLTYGEYRIQGSTDDEVLISSHVCHPSLCNDNLSGVATAAVLASLLDAVDLRYSYRFVWAPGTIGAITWLALNEPLIPRIKHGLVLSCVGDPGRFTYKRSRRGDAEIDRVVEHVLRSTGRHFEVMDFTPYGYDERQYCSPGINLPVGSFMRTPNGKYPQYHTSADDLTFVTGPALADSLFHLLGIIEVLEGNYRYLNLKSKCEPQLGRRGLYRQVGGTNNTEVEEAMLWVLNYSDGKHSLLDIAEHSRLEFTTINDAAELLARNNLLQVIDPITSSRLG